jgi:alginate O-acetyltransferase complex protein AlgJ
MQQKKNNIFVMTVFLAAIILPLVFSDKTGGKVSTTENRYLAAFPTILTTDMKLAPGIQNGLENWINDNAGFRTQIKKLQATIDYRVFHTSPSSLVHIGKDGWFFYTGDHNLDIETGTYPITLDLLNKIKVNQENIQQALKEKGIEYVIVLTPSKVSVYPEYIGGGNFAVRNTVIDIVSDYLRKNTTIPIINIKPDLLQAKNTEVVYFKTDSHWNEAGAYIGYCAVISALNELGLIHNSPVNVSTVPSVYRGEFSTLMGNDELLPPEPVETTRVISPNAVKIESGDNFDKMQQLMQEDNNKNGFYIYKNLKTENNKLLIYGDSFFASWNMGDLLAENFSNLDFIFSDAIKNNDIKQLNPDIVILERTERFIYTLADPVDPALIFEPLKDPEAEVVSDTTPSQVELGKNYAIDITIKNIGTETWDENRRIRLAIFQDGVDKYRIKLPDGVEVRPGETYTFKFEDFQVPPEKSTLLQYQMVEETVEYFGKKKIVNLTIKQ